MSGAAPGPRPEKAGTQGRIEPILDRLHGLHPRLIDLSLDRLRRLLAALGHPERRLPPVLHVGGTNGKGSTAAMTAALQSAVQRQEPIVVTLWTPTWMFEKFEMKFLADPQGVFAPPQSYNLIARNGFSTEKPEAREILSGIFMPIADVAAINSAVADGQTMEAALQETADRLGTSEFQFFVITLAIQRETGGNLAETLSNLADVLRKRAQMKLKIRAMSSEAKASAMIVGALPFIVFTLVYMLNPNYMGGFFTEERLIVAGIGALVWMSIGVAVMAKMVNFEI